jgi:hypothetical protein
LTRFEVTLRFRDDDEVGKFRCTTTTASDAIARAYERFDPTTTCQVFTVEAVREVE